MAPQQTSSAADAPKIAAATGSRLHLPFLDGIRGLAALYVVFGHVAHWLIWWAEAHGQNSLWLKVFRVFAFPQYAVDTFIVLSGFCLMLPIVTRGTLNSKFDFWSYIQRRFRRIYPPYFAALLLTIALIFVAHRLIPAGGVVNDSFSAGNFISHLLLLHNLSPVWARSMGNDPLWSVATEWQIYFLFPLILLPVRRFAGRIATIFAGLFLGWGALWASKLQLIEADPWLLGLFAMGMVGAELALENDEKTRVWCARIPWIGLSITGAIALAIARHFSENFFEGGFNRYQYIADPVFGLVALSLLVGLVAGSKSKLQTFIGDFFSSRLAMFMGVYSYSVYLFHFPLLHLIVDPLCQRWNLNLQQRMIFGLLYIPFALIVTYGFHLCFELPFIKSKKVPAISK